jgi:hypothetical protein
MFVVAKISDQVDAVKKTTKRRIIHAMLLSQ